MVKLRLNILQVIMWILPLPLLQIHGNMLVLAKVQELEVSKAYIFKEGPQAESKWVLSTCG